MKRTRRVGGKIITVKMVKTKRRKRRGPKATPLLKNKFLTKLRYVDTISLDPGIAAITNHVFRCNSLFDPDSTGAGHQPLIFDEFAELYQEYRVLKAKIKVTPIPTTTSNVNPGLYGVFRDSDSILDYTLGTSVIEDMRVKGGWGYAGTSSFAAGYNPPSRTASYNVKTMTSPEQRDESTDVGANPVNQDFFQVWLASIAGNNPGAVQFMVQIDYLVEFTQPQTVTPS